MALAIKVIYENGVFRPVEPVDLPEGQEAVAMVEPADDDSELAEIKAILSDLPIRWANPDDDRDAWVEDMADEIDKAFQGDPPLSQIIIEDRGDM